MSSLAGQGAASVLDGGPVPVCATSGAVVRVAADVACGIRPPPRPARHGLALIVVIGVLGVLAVLAVAFLTMAQLERRASEQRVNAARAYLLARSGIEDALARLDLGQDAVYGGENWDGSADGLLTTYEEAQQVYHRTRIGTPADIDACPARHAMRPSFFVRAAGNPAVVRVEGRDRGYSGRLSTDSYALKVSSGQGFFINGGDPAAPATEGYNAVLRRMLGTLAGEIGVPLSEADGLALVDARPASGWRSLQQVRDMALDGSPEKLEALKDYLALHAWVDRKVIAPNAHEGMASKNYQSWGEIKLDHLETSPGSRAPDFERIPVKGGRIVGRAPVDLAWARRRRPALVALLGGLKGLYLDESAARPFQGGGAGSAAWTGGDWIGALRAAEIGLDEARGIAGHLLASTEGIGTWAQWDAFVDAGLFAAAPSLALTRAKRDLLKANFNPNSRLNKFNPNGSLRRTVDKQDLLAYSTEFSLLPLQGPKAVESAGRVLTADGRLLAGRVLGARVAGPGVVRLTTQKEFVCETLGALDLAGDEGDFRLPGRTPYVTRSAGLSRTWGHGLGIPALGDRGASLQVYPEPCADPGSGLAVRPADYDGGVQLATVETGTEDTYGVPVLSGNMGMTMLARYASGLDLDVAGGSGSCQPDVDQAAGPELANGLLDGARPNTLYPDGCYSEKGRASSYLDQGNANGFHGVMSFWIKSNHAAPGFRGHPFVKWTNFREEHYDNHGIGTGVDQFFFLGDAPTADLWVDPGGGLPGNWGMQRSPPAPPAHRARSLWDWLVAECEAPIINPEDIDPGQPRLDPGRGPLVCQFEVGHHTGDTQMEHRFSTARPLQTGRWQLVTLFYDFRGVGPNQTGALLVDSGLLTGTTDLGSYGIQTPAAAGDRDRGDEYPGSIGLPSQPTAASDITEHDFFGAHRIGLGWGRPRNEYTGVSPYTGSGADATFDEFAIYDFGGATPPAVPASPLTLASPSTLALNRFREGRYYKESRYGGLFSSLGLNSAAEYFSPPIRLPGPCRILGLSWTQVLPKELPLGRVSFELVDIPGTGYLPDAQGRSIDDRFTHDAFSPVGRAVDKPFRLHAVFQPNLADPINTPILDPLALDDLTLCYDQGLRLLAWEDVED